MRPLYLLALLLFAPAALAQSYAIDKGSFILGGTVSYTSQGGDAWENFDGDRYNTLLINPSAGYFVIPNLAISAEISFRSISQGDESIDTYGIGPAVTYYFGGPASTVYPFLGAGVAYASLDGDASGFGIGAEGGAVFMLSRSVGLRGALSYVSESYSVDGIDDSIGGNTLGLEIGVTAFIF